MVAIRLDGPQRDRQGIDFWTLAIMGPERLMVVLLDREALQKHRQQLDLAMSTDRKDIPPVFAQASPVGDACPADSATLASSREAPAEESSR